MCECTRACTSVYVFFGVYARVLCLCVSVDQPVHSVPDLDAIEQGHCRLGHASDDETQPLGDEHLPRLIDALADVTDAVDVSCGIARDAHVPPL